MVTNMTYDDIYTEDVLLREETQKLGWHRENDRRIEVILAFADQMMETKDEKKMEQLIILLKKEEKSHSLENSGDLLFLYLAAGIFCEEREYQIYPTIFHVCSGFQDMITLLRQVKFFLWRYQQNIGDINVLGDYAKEKRLSVCVLYNMMAAANVWEISWLKEQYGKRQECLAYLEGKEKQN